MYLNQFKISQSRRVAIEGSVSLFCVHVYNRPIDNILALLRCHTVCNNRRWRWCVERWRSRVVPVLDDNGRRWWSARRRDRRHCSSRHLLSTSSRQTQQTKVYSTHRQTNKLT